MYYLKILLHCDLCSREHTNYLLQLEFGEERLRPVVACREIIDTGQYNELVLKCFFVRSAYGEKCMWRFNAAGKVINKSCACDLCKEVDTMR